MIDFEKAKNWSEERLMFEINEISIEINKLENEVNRNDEEAEIARQKHNDIEEQYKDPDMRRHVPDWKESRDSYMNKLWEIRMRCLDDVYRLRDEVKLKIDVKAKLKAILQSK
jgi:DNA-directed RNA polymerase specialized sigma subunit